MECLVCRGEVTNLTPRAYRGLVLACPRCGPYRIVGGCADALGKLGIDGRLAALETAKDVAPGRAWPTIDVRCIKNFREGVDRSGRARGPLRRENT